jgi:tRNA(adenine34) deaminase
VIEDQQNHEYWMQRALELAACAEQSGEVPVGAVLIRDGKVLGEGWNRSISDHDPSAHAEIVAMRNAGRQLDNYRLPGTTLYVTLEPCPMCVGAMIHARIERLVFGAADPKTGALGGAFSLPQIHRHNHVLETEGGVLAAEAGEMLRSFFRRRRKSSGNGENRD